MSGGSSSENPHYHKYPSKDRKRRIIYKKGKKAIPIVLPKWAPTGPVKVIPLPPIRNYRGGRNKSSLLWYKCDNCDDRFPVRTGRKKKSEYAFCGKRCQASFHSQRLKGHEISAQTRKKISDTKRGIGSKDEPQTRDGKTWHDFASNPKKLVQTIDENPNRLIRAECQIAESLGIQVTLLPDQVRYSLATGRISVRWRASTTSVDDALRWADICPPDDIKKKQAVENWQRKIVEDWLNRKSWMTKL